MSEDIPEDYGIQYNDKMCKIDNDDPGMLECIDPETGETETIDSFEG